MLRGWMLALPRRQKQCLVVAVDVVLVLAAVWLAFSFRLENPHMPVGVQWWVYGLSPVLAVPIFSKMGLYRAVFRYTGMAAMVTLGRAVAWYALLFVGLLMVAALPTVPRSVLLLQPLVVLMLVGGVRAVARHWLSGLSGQQRVDTHHLGRLVIYGAGTAGVQIAMALSRSHEFDIVAFVDDDASVQGRTINGLNVFAPHELPELVKNRNVTDLLLAMPSISRVRRAEVLHAMQPLPVHVRSLPALSDLAQGRVSVSDIKELDIEDLLGRNSVDPDPMLLVEALPGKVVLVTGAGGSIGSELCRQILAHQPASLVLLEHSEFALYRIHRELEQMRGVKRLTTVITPVLCNVQNEYKVLATFKTHRPEIVYHAAAYKHVPLVEHNPAEGVANNVFGTYNVAKACLVTQVRHMVLISTDKAVRPTNVMGASKRLSELVLQALSALKALRTHDGPSPYRRATDESVHPRTLFPNRTNFSMVRFGNVLGSSGSVVPLFREQIAKGGPITLTDAKVTRYFMTIPEAVHLVLQAGAMAKGGEVFVLDMGRPVRIYDLARRMIELSGLALRNSANPNGDIEIQVTGLRPGEKLYEELLIGDDPQPTAHPRIMMAREKMVPWNELAPQLTQLRHGIDHNDIPLLRDILLDLVDGFKPGDLIADGFSDSDLPPRSDGHDVDGDLVPAALQA